MGGGGGGGTTRVQTPTASLAGGGVASFDDAESHGMVEH